jgi:riboflavin synthase
MFTGIVEHVGTVESLSLHSDGGRVVIHAPSLAASLAVSNSIAVNGCCLTIVSLKNERFSADLSGETVRRTSFGATDGLKTGARVNLEQPLTAGKEFGGHFVLGHVDGVGRVAHLRPEGENWWYGVQVPEEFAARYIVPKGSVAIDGISLTVANWRDRIVEIAVIPYTFAHTNLNDLEIGNSVNLEGDILGKYIERRLDARTSVPHVPSLTVQHLKDQGF